MDIRFSASEVDTEREKGFGNDVRSIKAAASVSFLQTKDCKLLPARAAADSKPLSGNPYP